MSTALRTSNLFGPVASSLGWVPPLRYLLRRRRILRLFSRRPSGTLLEVGCGGGALLHEFGQMGHRCTGLESSPEALTMAQSIAEVGNGAQKVCIAPEATWHGAFDSVCAFDVLEHISDDGAALDQWLQWLKPEEGRLVISVPAHPHRWGAGDVWAGHYRRYERIGLIRLLESKGLEVEHFECYGFPLANLTEIVGDRSYRRQLLERGEVWNHEDASAHSGVDRHEYQHLFRYINTLPGRLALRIALALQALTSRFDWGSGYLVMARMK